MGRKNSEGPPPSFGRRGLTESYEFVLNVEVGKIQLVGLGYLYVWWGHGERPKIAKRWLISPPPAWAHIDTFSRDMHGFMDNSASSKRN